MGNFLATVTKVTKMTGVTIPSMNPLGENTYTTTSNTIRPSTSTMAHNSSHNLDETRNTPRQTMTSISNLHSRIAVSSAARSVNSMTSNYSWEMAPQPPRQTASERGRQMESRQQTDNILYGLTQQQPPSAYDNLMLNLTQERSRRMFEETRGRRMGPTNVSTLPNRSASHDPGGSYLMNQQMNQYPEIPSVPSSNNGDIAASNASDSYQIYRRARSSPPRLTDIPPNYIAQIDRSMNAYQIEYNKGAPVNLSSNSSSGNEGHSNSTMTMAAVSAERCTDWVKDSRICVQKNELIKDNHYSIKDVEKTETTDQAERKTAKGSNYPGGQSSGDDSTAASCGSTPPTVEGSDDSKNSSDTDSPDNDASGNMKQDKRETEEKQHKRVHYQDHKLSAKNIKQHQKINRRLQRSPMKLVQNKSTENFQKPRKAKKAKVPKHHNKETETEKDASKNNGNGASDSNGTSDSNGEGSGSNGSSNGNGTSDQWTRSSSNTPSPPTSFGSAGSNDNTSSIDPSSSSTESLQVMSSHFPKPFWKKRFCEDEASTQQSNDNIQSTININETKNKSDDSDTNKSSNSGAEESQQNTPSKRRKLDKYQHDHEITEETDLSHMNNPNEDHNSRRRKDVKDNRSNGSNDSSPRTATPNAISTDSGHESRGSD